MAGEVDYDADVLILGQGLAGSTLAWRLAERGVSAIVVDRGGVDRDGRPSASRVAAGLITPVTGKRLTVADDYDTHWASARAFYRSVEEKTGAKLLTEAPALRLFRNSDERDEFGKRLAFGLLGSYARRADVADLAGAPPAPHGAFVMPGAARLDVPTYLTATAAWLDERLLRSACDVGVDLRVDDKGVVMSRLGVAARCLALCLGHSAPPCRWMDGIDFSPAKGEVLMARSDTLRSERVIHHGVWIAPEGDGVYRVGSTTEWHRIDSKPTDGGRRELLRRLAEAGVADAEVLERQAAVRPATPDRRPTHGFSKREPRVGWFNGLGAKGALWAPWHAERMADRVVRALV